MVWSDVRLGSEGTQRLNDLVYRLRGVDADTCKRFAKRDERPRGNDGVPGRANGLESLRGPNQDDLAAASLVTPDIRFSDDSRCARGRTGLVELIVGAR